MATLTFDRNGTKVGLALAIMSGRLGEESARMVLAAAEHVAGTIREVVYEKFPDGRTGALARSFRPVFLGRDNAGVSAAAASDLVYARIQDEGGKILPKTVKRLAVPIKGAGVPIGKWPRHFAKGELTFVNFGRLGMSAGDSGKPPILARVYKNKKGETIRFKPMFVLLSSVTITGKRYLDTAADRAAEGVEEIMAEGYARAIDRGLDDGGVDG